MSEDRTSRTVEIECAEEGRTARLLVELEGGPTTGRVVGVQCDNPKLEDHHHWECGWSCWEKVEDQLRDEGES